MCLYTLLSQPPLPTLSPFPLTFLRLVNAVSLFHQSLLEQHVKSLAGLCEGDDTPDDLRGRHTRERDANATRASLLSLSRVRSLWRVEAPLHEVARVQRRSRGVEKRDHAANADGEELVWWGGDRGKIKSLRSRWRFKSM